MAIHNAIADLGEFNKIPTNMLPSERVLSKVGSCIIKDMRCLHRGTANKSKEIRPILSYIFCRKWYRIPYDSLYQRDGYPPMKIKASDYKKLSKKMQSILRFCTVIE